MKPKESSKPSRVPAPTWALDGPRYAGHESLRVSGPTLSRLIEAVIEPRAAGSSPSRVSAWLDLLADLEGVSVDAWYEEDRIRIGSLVRFE